VYAVEPNTGLGGWTWYTGSAGWMYRLVLESLLGLRLKVDRLLVAPCVPAGWPGFTVRYRYRATLYVLVAAPAAEGVARGRLVLDGVVLEQPWLPLVDDGMEHAVQIAY
jgi:cellobiose phosphorylase